jgi:nucleoid-associated protein YgaU
LQKAKLISANIKGKEVKELECQFNPESLTITKTVEWGTAKSDDSKKEAQPQLNAPTLAYGGGNPAEFSLDLIFDTTTMENQDVRGYTNQLLSLTLMGAGDPKRSEEDPPVVQFVWGEFILFIAVITKIEISYTLFLASGIPVRARAKVNFKQRLDEDGKLAAQNPTTRTEARKTHVVQQGDRLDYLAYEEYGQPGLWREIASANDLDDPLDIQPGQILIIPRLP